MSNHSRRTFLGAGLTAAGVAALAGPLAGPLAGRALAATPRPRRADIALTHVTVVDTVSGKARRDMTVLVAGDRISTVGRAAQVPVPAGATVVDGTGKFLIPGLCDMHVHSSYEDIDLPLHIANGVTTVREMWGLPSTHDWRRRIEGGSLLGPRYIIGSTIIDGSPTLWNASAPRPAAPLVVRDEAEARRAVRQVKRDGADFVKIYSRLSESAFHGIADESRRLRLRFGGHLPDVVPVDEGVRAGMWSFEHLDGLWWSTSDREATLRRQIAGMTIDPADAYGSWFRQIGVLEWEAATTYRPDKAARMFAELRRAGSWQVPTLTMLQRLDIPGDADDPRLKYVPAGDAGFWEMWADARTNERTPRQVAEHRVLFELRQRLVGEMSRAGVPILAGTDTGTTYQFPGFSLHDELALLVQAGLTPAQALRAGTWEPARALGLEASQGSVAAGKIADLVLLAADPLADIRNTQRIESVVVRGQLVTAQRRQELLDGAAAAPNPPGGAATAARPAMARCGCLAHRH